MTREIVTVLFTVLFFLGLEQYLSTLQTQSVL